MPTLPRQLLIPKHRIQSWGTVVLLCLAAFGVGCNRTSDTLPEAPAEAVRAMVKGLSDNQPKVLWAGLPPSYQQDIKDLITEFSTQMDPALYDRSFKIFQKGVRVLREKKDYVFNNPYMLSTPLIESSMGPQWNETVDLLSTLASSDLSSLQSLRTMDPGEFLATTGRRLMELGESLRRQSQREAKPSRWEQTRLMMKQAQIDFVQASETTGILKINSAATNEVQEFELTKVEGRWVPSEMAASWDERVEEAKEGLAKLSGPEFQKLKPLLTIALGSVEEGIDSLLRAGSQKEFDDALLKGMAFLGGMLQGLRPQTDKEAE